ncbi:MAG TPA: hypothetical protein VJ301_12085 [Propionibacteriaceae bacterium]|nr:hypothetical protein [Propionibacteriaceae bacterium]
MDGAARPRIRWAWIAGCVVLGLAAIAAGWAIVPDANRTGYGAGVLANVGTTLLLVGIVARAGDRWTPRPKRAGWRTSTPAASSTPRAATASGTDRSLEQEGVGSLTSRPSATFNAKMLVSVRTVMSVMGG